MRQGAWGIWGLLGVVDRVRAQLSSRLGSVRRAVARFCATDVTSITPTCCSKRRVFLSPCRFPLALRSCFRLCMRHFRSRRTTRSCHNTSQTATTARSHGFVSGIWRNRTMGHRRPHRRRHPKARIMLRSPKRTAPPCFLGHATRNGEDAIGTPNALLLPRTGPCQRWPWARTHCRLSWRSKSRRRGRRSGLVHRRC